MAKLALKLLGEQQNSFTGGVASTPRCHATVSISSDVCTATRGLAIIVCNTAGDTLRGHTAPPLLDTRAEAAPAAAATSAAAFAAAAAPLLVQPPALNPAGAAAASAAAGTPALTGKGRLGHWDSNAATNAAPSA